MIFKLVPVKKSYLLINIALIIFFLIIFESVLYYQNFKYGILYGDFYTTHVNKKVATTSYLVSIFSLLSLFFIVFFFSNKKEEKKFPIGSNFYTFMYFLILFFINVFLIGKNTILSADKSYLGLLTSLVPAHLLIIFLFCGKKNIFFFLSLTLLLLMNFLNGLYYVFLIAVYCLSFYLKLSIKNIMSLILISPILFLILNFLIITKFEMRGTDVVHQNDLINNHFFARISISQTLAYIIDNQKKLGATCFEKPYQDPIKVLVMQIIPKKIFGFENPKNVNNCLIDFKLKEISTNTTLKATFPGNLIIIYNNSLNYFFFYIFFLFLIILSIMILFNYLLGNKSIIFNFFIFWKLVAEGDTGIIWVLYFGLTMYTFFILMKPFYFNDSKKKNTSY